MATNTSSQYQAAIRRQLSKEVLPIAKRHMVVYQFAEKRRIEKGAGVTWTATRFNRLPLPYAPLSEGVPPIGETLTISQVTGVALQWGDKVTLTDVAVTTTMYDLIQQSKRLLGVQVAETHERNAYLALMGGTQVNYVNSRGSRAALTAGDVLDTITVNRTYSDLETLGAPFYNGQTEPHLNREIEHGPRRSSQSPSGDSEHYVAIVHPLVENDLRQNATIVQAWSYSDITRLYINEVGYWAGIHFTKSNMVPRFVGNATAGSPTPSNTGGALPAGTYYIIITGTDSLNLYGEQLIYAISAGQVVGGAGAGSIAVTMPSTAGYTYTVYLDTNSTGPVHMAGTTTSGVGSPTSGPYTGMATQLNPGAAVTLTSVGPFQVPPAAPAAGVTVYATFVFGAQYFACLQLESITWTSLFEADKSDPLNQLRVIGWKDFEGYVILNQQFGCRIESSASNTGAFG